MGNCCIKGGEEVNESPCVYSVGHDNKVVVCGDTLIRDATCERVEEDE